MKKFRPSITVILSLVFLTSSTYAQQSNYLDDENYSSAYVESSHTANWSVYIPITILVGAAIWFGLADGDKDKNDSSNSQNGLGSVAARGSHSKHYKSSNYSSSRSSSGSYSHN